MKKLIVILALLAAVPAHGFITPPVGGGGGGGGVDTGGAHLTITDTTVALDAEVVKHNKCIYVETLADESLLMILRPPNAITITEVQCKASAGTPTVNLNLAVAASNVLTSALTCTTAAAGATSTTFTDATIPADEPVSLVIAGTAAEDYLVVCYDYTIDDI